MGRLSGVRRISDLNLNKKALIKAVAESSEYYQYEVEDVLNHLVKVIQKVLKKRGTVKIDGLGTIVPRIYGAKTWYDPHKQRQFSSPEALTVSIRADTELRRILNKVVKEENANKTTSD